jgi:hypothetical protein
LTVDNRPVIGHDEPFGSQAIRRLHGWATLYADDLPHFTKHCEHGPTRELVERYLRRAQDEQKELAAFHQEHYPAAYEDEAAEGTGVGPDGEARDTEEGEGEGDERLAADVKALRQRAAEQREELEAVGKKLEGLTKSLGL